MKIVIIGDGKVGHKLTTQLLFLIHISKVSSGVFVFDDVFHSQLISSFVKGRISMIFELF